MLQKKGEYITYENGLWGVTSFLKDGELNNVWLVEAGKEKLIYFYGNHEVTALSGTPDSEAKEQVADLFFTQGSLKKVKEKRANQRSGVEAVGKSNRN